MLAITRRPSAITAGRVAKRPSSKLTPGSGSQALCDQTTAAQCLAKYGAGAYNQELFQPADRFWPFQGIETALFVALAVVLLLLAVHLVRRRVA
jgi:hypothetical protein